MSLVWFSEIDDYASAVLKKHWSETPNIGDITKVDWNGIKKPDMLAGGFPCQDISIAGKGKGIKEGTRSGLWIEFAKAISYLRPKYVLIENVGRIKENGMQRVADDLKTLGYISHQVEISAEQIGANTKRERLFFIAHLSSFGCLNCPSIDKEYEIQRNPLWSSTQNIRSGAGWKRWLIEASQNMDGQISKSDFCGVADGIPKELDRIRCLGNAVVPQVSEAVGRMILEMVKSSPIPPTDKSVGILGDD